MKKNKNNNDRWQGYTPADCDCKPVKAGQRKVRSTKGRTGLYSHYRYL